MADLRAKGLIKEKSGETDGDEEAKKRYEAIQNEQAVSWLMIIGVIVGMLALMAAMGGIVVWVILTVYDEVSCCSHGFVIMLTMTNSNWEI